MPEMHPTALRFQERAQAAGLHVRAQELSESTRTAVEAADAVGCELGQIVKSVVLQDASGDLLLCLCAGDRRIDLERVGEGVTMARGRDVKEQTGYAIGGIPPLGHDRPLHTVVDSSLRRFQTVWCAAGTPNAVFEVRLDDLLAAMPDADEHDIAGP
jgi:prolyl-tRNA editing enzyme YbaK/EbsC (Cys-tRNA(Pro) deacylase)